MTRGMGADSVSSITPHIAGVRFPATRGDMLRQARQTGAAKDVMDVLHCVPDREFATVADVMQALGEMERRADGAER